MATAEANPLSTGLERLPVHPTTLVIFGATGDLSRRKLLPAIYNLAHEGALPERFQLVGASRGEMTDAQFQEQAIESIRRFSRRAPDDEVLNRMVEGIRYVVAPFDDPGGYERLGATLSELDEAAGVPLNRCFYLST